MAEGSHVIGCGAGPLPGSPRKPRIKGGAPRETRRLISEAKRFSTEACVKAVNNAMQVMGGIGYTNVFPMERIYRDIRLGADLDWIK